MKKNIIIQTGLLVIGVLFLITANSISTMGFSGDVLNQRTYVVVLSWILVIFAGVGIIREFLKGRKGESVIKVSEAEGKMIELEDEAELSVKKNSSSKVYLSMFLIFIFVLGFTYIGYYVTSLIFVFLITWLMFDWNKKKWIASLIFSVGLNVILFILFNLINVYFPKTLLF
jgi:hypothetical protein